MRGTKRNRTTREQQTCACYTCANNAISRLVVSAKAIAHQLWGHLKLPTPFRGLVFLGLSRPFARGSCSWVEPEKSKCPQNKKTLGALPKNHKRRLRNEISQKNVKKKLEKKLQTWNTDSQKEYITSSNAWWDSFIKQKVKKYALLQTSTRFPC